MDDNKRYWIWIVMAFGTANPKIWEIINKFNSAFDAYTSLESGEFGCLTDKERRGISSTHIEQCDRIIEYCEKMGYNIITFDNKDYPHNLKNIYNPPAVLFCMGDIHKLNEKIGITIVGTRKPSDYSIKAAEKICDQLVKRDFSIISGFAVGIDSVAHKTAIKNDGCTIAVLGCGIDVDYPKPNSSAKPLLAQNGVIITEFFPGTRPDGRNFPIRNRILSGLGIGTLVIEAGIGSGSLITAEYAIEQGKELFCIPPSDIFDKRYAGVIKYLRDGAIPVFSHLDILYEYYTVYTHKISTPEFNVNPDESMIFHQDYCSNQNDQTKIKKTDSLKKELDISGLSAEQTKIVEYLKSGEKHADDISSMLELDIIETLTLLTELEMDGYVKGLFGKMFVLAND